MEAYLVYVTCENAVEAQLIGRRVVEERLAACANIAESITSIYRWQGEVVEGQEALLTLKSSATRLELLIHRISELHSYEVPAIEAVSIAHAPSNFLTWLKEETAPGKDS